MAPMPTIFLIQTMLVLHQKLSAELLKGVMINYSHVFIKTYLMMYIDCILRYFYYVFFKTIFQFYHNNTGWHCQQSCFIRIKILNIKIKLTLVFSTLLKISIFEYKLAFIKLNGSLPGFKANKKNVDKCINSNV